MPPYLHSQQKKTHQNHEIPNFRIMKFQTRDVAQVVHFSLLPVADWFVPHEKKCFQRLLSLDKCILTSPISRILRNSVCCAQQHTIYGVAWYLYTISRSVLVIDVLGCLQFSYELLTLHNGGDTLGGKRQEFPSISSLSW